MVVTLVSARMQLGMMERIVGANIPERVEPGTDLGYRVLKTRE